MIITDCKVNHLVNPLGYRMERVVFSWKICQAKGRQQRHARLCVAEDNEFRQIVWDSGEREQLDSIACEAMFPLKPRTRYFWQVRVTSDLDETAESDIQFFETGKREEPWTAHWISCRREESRHPIFFNRLKIEGMVYSARLYICGLGLYEAYLDGIRIGQEYLAPYCNDYSRWLQYQTYDVTEQVRNGAELSVLLGNGWYKGRFSLSAQDTEGKYGKDFQLIAELHLDYVDGRHQVIGTDESWKVRRSSLIFSGIYDGECRDDTLSDFPEEACIPGYEDTGKLTERMSQPVAAYREWKPLELLHTPAGEMVLDMGQNFAGTFRLHVHEPAGTKIHLQFGEVLQNGNFFRDNLRTALAEYVFVSGGEEIVLEPHFTFYGYRYVKIEGIPLLEKEDFTAVALSSLYVDGGFHTGYLSGGHIDRGHLFTGHPLVNRLITNAWWSLRSNSVDVPTDCPQRDERLGWTGDAQVFSGTACCMEDMYAFYAKYLYDMAREQSGRDGKVPEYIPSRGRDNTSSAWGDAACIIPWTLYQWYGDKEILREQYSSMKGWVDYIRRMDGENRGWSREFHFGDWLALDNETGDPRENSGATDKGYIAYVYYMESARLVAKAAVVLGKAEEAAQYNRLAEELHAYIRHEYFSGSGRCCINTQTALIMALHYHLTDNEDWTRARLREMFSNRKDKLATGFIGTPLACLTLSENGMGDLACKLLLNEEYPGWLYAVKLGATTIWERWDSILADGSISDTGMNSLNHYAYGSVVQWIFQYVGGIRQCDDSVGYRSVIFAPLLSWQLGMADAAIDTPFGKYRCAWKLVDTDHVELRLSVPFGGQARLMIPEADPLFLNQEMHMQQNRIFERMEGEICILEPGEYSLTYKTSHSLKPEYSCAVPMRELFEQTEIKKMLLERLPQLALVKDSLQVHSLGEILIMVAGNVGLPDRDTTRNQLIPELDAAIKALSCRG